eukprot:6210894-Pleurochrysis_carterae.AAC.4
MQVNEKWQCSSTLLSTRTSDAYSSIGSISYRGNREVLGTGLRSLPIRISICQEDINSLILAADLKLSPEHDH